MSLAVGVLAARLIGMKILPIELVLELELRGRMDWVASPPMFQSDDGRHSIRLLAT